MNMLVAGTPQIFSRDGWVEKMNATVLHSANRLDDPAVARLSAEAVHGQWDGSKLRSQKIRSFETYTLQWKVSPEGS